MKRKSKITFLDLNYFLIIFGFTILAFDYDQVTGVRFVSALLGLTLFIHFVLTYRQRVRLQKLEEEIVKANYYTEDSANENERAIYNKLNGNALERSVYNYLKNHYKDITLFRNIKIPSSSSNNTEIDILGIIDNKIYVFECKNYNVELSGNWNDNDISALYTNPIKISNPVKQNEFHIKQLEKVLFEGRNYYGNIVVFGKDTKIPYQETPLNTQVCKIHYIDKAIKNLRVMELDPDTKYDIIEVLKLF